MVLIGAYPRCLNAVLVRFLPFFSFFFNFPGILAIFWRFWPFFCDLSYFLKGLSILLSSNAYFKCLNDTCGNFLAIFWQFFGCFWPFSEHFEKVNRLKKFPNKVFEKLKKEQMLTNLAAKLWALPQNLDQN